ncbi:MAG: DoxX family membrane protein [Candidatus Marinimicrobia bacterium]|nr:DoxX family membrane protein [Candidatus Neomarinimicrobiota bacterium]
MSWIDRLHKRLDSLPPFPGWTHWPVAAGRILLGIMFIFSGLAKVMDAQTFLNTLPLYNVPDWTSVPAALMPAVEVALGVALLAGMAPALVALSTIGLLAAFSVLLVAGILGGELETCGCFGAYLQTSPQLALLRNLILVLVAVAVWYYHRREESSWRAWQVGLLMAVLLLAGTYTGYTIQAPAQDDSLAQVGELFPIEGLLEEEFPLEGENLVFVFAVNCEHCWNAVNNVKELASRSGLPMLGVTLSPAYEIDRFVREFGIDFPIYRYDQQSFFEAFHTWPALYYLQEGTIVGRVDDEVPSLKTLREVHLLEWE